VESHKGTIRSPRAYETQKLTGPELFRHNHSDSGSTLLIFQAWVLQSGRPAHPSRRRPTAWVVTSRVSSPGLQAHDGKPDHTFTLDHTKELRFIDEALKLADVEPTPLWRSLASPDEPRTVVLSRTGSLPVLASVRQNPNIPPMSCFGMKTLN